MKEIHIAVIATVEGFRQFTSDIDTYEEPELPYIIKFHHIDNEQKTRGAIYNTYIVHYTYKYLQYYTKIISRVKSRIIHLGN